MDLYTQVHARRHLPNAAPWISEDRLLEPSPYAGPVVRMGDFWILRQQHYVEFVPSSQYKAEVINDRHRKHILRLL